MAKKKQQTVDIEGDFETYRANALYYPGLYCIIADRLGLDTSVLEGTDVGYYPAWDAFAFPERNHEGDVIGMTLRTSKGKKLCAEGGKRGLFYSYNYEATRSKNQYDSSRLAWTRTDTDRPCPICGRVKYCLLDRDNPHDPGRVLCMFDGKNSKRQTKQGGWIHELKPGSDLYDGAATILRPTDLPRIIGEGASDYCAALQLGHEAIGRPGNTSGIDMLSKMPLNGDTAWIIGENDQQVTKRGVHIHPGKDGVDRTFLALRGKCECVRVYPPKGIKDLREWVKAGLTQDQLAAYVEEHGDHSSTLPDDILADDHPMNIAERFIDEELTREQVITVRKFRGKYYIWDDYRYTHRDNGQLRGRVYQYLRGKQFVKETQRGQETVPLKADARLVSNVIDTLSARDLAIYNQYCWIRDDLGWDINDIVAFKNGLLNITTMEFKAPTPRYFNTCASPFDYDPDASYDYCLEYLHQIVDDDNERVDLLQEWFGYNHTPDIRMQKLMLLIGPSRCGKGTILRMIQAMTGPDQYLGISWANLANRFGREPMLGKSIATLGDARTPTRAQRQEVLECLLRITGGDTVGVDQKGIPELGTEVMQVRLSIAVNELPAFIDNASALANRMLIVDLHNSYAGREDYMLDAKLAKEITTGGLSNWAIDGIRRLRESGRFTQPESAKHTERQFAELTAPIHTFVDECCEMGEGKDVDKKILFKIWAGWCKENNYPIGNNVAFGRNLNSSYRIRAKRTQDESGLRSRVYIGISPCESAAVQYLED